MRIIAYDVFRKKDILCIRIVFLRKVSIILFAFPIELNPFNTNFL